jgi:hypothetical protein
MPWSSAPVASPLASQGSGSRCQQAHLWSALWRCMTPCATESPDLGVSLPLLALHNARLLENKAVSVDKGIAL